MNTPIQGPAADIMKIAMIKVMNELKQRNMKSKIVLQVHDEMMIEAPIDEVEDVKELLKRNMDNVIKLKVPLVADVVEATNWYDAHYKEGKKQFEKAIKKENISFYKLNSYNSYNN